MIVNFITFEITLSFLLSVQPESRSPKALHTPVLPQIVTKTNVAKSYVAQIESPVPVKFPRTPEPETPRAPSKVKLGPLLDHIISLCMIS